MAAKDHLNTYQFTPAHIEGKAASDWLSTPHGHTWQTKKFTGKYKVGPSDRSRASDRTGMADASFGMFSLKNQVHS